MGKPTFGSFYDTVRELEGVYGHQELWLYSGIKDATADDVIHAKHNWKSPKILKRNGSIVAERMDNSNSWQLVGDYKKPLSQHCAPPWQSCQIDAYFKGSYILIEGRKK
ncbi:hypothetical protein NNQ28_22575 (plasmid) [Cronobacter dublinensis]|uniref:hypothetical protein n=1 Tax=Cronobacter dublinensis TaxID=413497 RepID=UPI0013757608|nr:hypothetical protein [Cronobacter dublinensis]ELY3838733.1 hypothetical protein [Cronobacter turicensis]NCH73621.1 hypothetical protein [Cronobacter dublinensis]WNY85181.1 hypothetical protein NNQ28_22575 [Cronobacter dublinensis]